MRTTDPNVVLLTRAVAQLGPLVDRVVFLGGCATALLLTDPAAPEVRPTQDVDVITEVGSLADYYRLAEGLRGAGFAEDQSPGAPLCRWRAPELILDVIPTDEDVFGFGNRWYRPALANAQLIDLPRWVADFLEIRDPEERAIIWRRVYELVTAWLDRLKVEP